MSTSIMLGMRFLDRTAELRRLDALAGPGLAVLWGRRRVGKTRLLLDWNRKRGGVYFVADQSAEPIQRSYFAETIATRVPGFAEVRYPDWKSLLRALAREVERGKLPGPILIDEVPYLVSACPSLPSVLQNFVDHEAKAAGLLLVLAGSSQRMMQGLVLDRASPLYGRARETLELAPLPPGYLGEALSLRESWQCVEAHAIWGGIPWYWELAATFGDDLEEAVDSLVLDPSGPLHTEADRLLLEEQPSAAPLRALLDAIGAGAHRLSEIGGRIGQPATSLSRPLARLVDLHLVGREQPFGVPERSGKRALYRILDPFFRAWFRLVAPHRGVLAATSTQGRRDLFRRLFPSLVAEQWEQLCRASVPRLPAGTLSGTHSWGPASRYWRGNGPEWDLVAESEDRSALLLGETKWTLRSATEHSLRQTYAELARKGQPNLPELHGRKLVHAVFVPKCPASLKRKNLGFCVIDASDVLQALR